MRLFSYIFKNDKQRDANIRNNILFSGFLKCVGLLTSLLVVPVTLGYLNNEVYGVWMTITSIMSWFTFFDIGLGNGMRNYLTKAISTGDYKSANAYLSTTLCVIALIAIGIAVVCILPLGLLDFNKVFNTTSVSGGVLRLSVFIAVAFTLVNFVVKNIGYVFIAMQRYALNDLLSVSGAVLGLIVVFILTKTTEGNLAYVVLALTASPVVVYLVASIPIFRHYKYLRPSVRNFNKQLLRQIVGKGLGFFFIQITSCLVIFGFSNLFITQFCGPESVTVYNIAYKFFNLLAIAYTIIISPLWNAYTNAYVKGDYPWIARTFKKSLKMWGLTVLAGVVMLLFCNLFYRLWLGGKVVVPLSISAYVLVYICMFNLNNCATYLINGLNKIRVQMITSAIGTAAYLIFLFLWGNKFGMPGVIINMAVSYLGMAVVHLYQCHLLVKGKAKGIWDK